MKSVLVLHLLAAVFCWACLWTPVGGFISPPHLRSPAQYHSTDFFAGRSRSQVGSSRSSSSPAHVFMGLSDVLRIPKDVVVIGGGLAGLSTALELAKRGRQVTVLSRNRSEAAAEAAGGMIAPQTERLESGPYLDLCLASRAMYADWVASVEAIAGLGGSQETTHFRSVGGFIAPAFEGDAVHKWNPPPEAGQAYWMERDQVLEMEPKLSPDIIGAWYYPQDMNIDAQRLFKVLEKACFKAGVEVQQGVSASGVVYDTTGTAAEGVILEDGRCLQARAIVSATGAWMRELLPVPMIPHKGQMMSLRVPGTHTRDSGSGGDSGADGRGSSAHCLTRVLYAEGCYIIPRSDGRIIVGSTVEPGEYSLHTTPAGMRDIMDAAMKVHP
ncbi:unnamed protein product, partial [Discosporangium mesarthrocarpum]